MENLPLAEHCFRVKKQYDLYHTDFEKFFGVPLKKFWDKVIGLDPIKFDEFINPPEGVSTNEQIEKNYGVEAKNFLDKYLTEIGIN